MSNLVKATILTEGRKLMASALAGATRFAPHSFTLGSAAGITLDVGRADVEGERVWTGDAASGLIQARLMDSSTVRYTLTIPEGEGPLTFGNVMLFANDFTGTKIPFIHITLPFQITKPVSDPNINNANPFPKPGSRLVISITVKHTVLEGNGNVTVTVVAPSYHTLPVFADEASLPPPEAQPWSQFILANHTRAGAPSVVTKRPDGTYWGMPTRNLQHPHFGYVDGGVGGDAYQTDNHGWAFGYYYRTATEDFSGQVGGYGYRTVTAYEPNIIGGTSYTE